MPLALEHGAAPQDAALECGQGHAETLAEARLQTGVDADVGQLEELVPKAELVLALKAVGWIGDVGEQVRRDHGARRPGGDVAEQLGRIGTRQIPQGGE